ncbi:MAG: sodium/proton-translocating pyrophosphatase, partial [Frankiaceae bacterium]
MSGLPTLSGGASVSVTNGQLTLVAVVAAVAVIALLTAGYLVRQVLAESEGTPRMIAVAHAIQEGAVAYLRRQYKTL